MDIEWLNKKLNNPTMVTSVLTGRARLAHDLIKQSAEYLDQQWLPFYFYLGKQLVGEKVVQLGVGQGLASICLLQAMPTIKTFLGLQPPCEWAKGICWSNLKDFYKNDFELAQGTLDDFRPKIKQQKWDIAWITEKLDYQQYRDYLELFWDNLSPQGLLLIDYIEVHDSAKKALNDFSEIKNRQPIVFNTRYGLGIIKQ